MSEIPDEEFRYVNDREDPETAAEETRVPVTVTAKDLGTLRLDGEAMAVITGTHRVTGERITFAIPDPHVSDQIAIGVLVHRSADCDIDGCLVTRRESAAEAQS